MRDFFGRNFPLFLGALLLLLVTFALLKLDLRGPSVPCDDRSLQSMCYFVDEQICGKTWNQLESKCQEILPQKMGRAFSPSEIISPKILKCQKVFFDKQFRYSRKPAGDPICDDLFEYIEERRHDFD